MDKNRPITDYEVEYLSDDCRWIPFGAKYAIQAELELHWDLIDNSGTCYIVPKCKCSEPTLRPNLPPTKTPNPDIDLLDRFAMASLTGICASQQIELKFPKTIAKICYEQAQEMLAERKKYLTIKQTDSE